jgi:phospholipid N-methyltransferase
MPNSVATYLHFSWAGLVKHRQTGGIVPSQRFLIAKMIAPVPAAYGGQVIELGAGSGALTLRLAARCPKARILACEINPTLAGDLSRNLAAAGLSSTVELFTGSAANLLSELGQNGLEKPDFVISGIPPNCAKSSVTREGLERAAKGYVAPEVELPWQNG